MGADSQKRFTIHVTFGSASEEFNVDNFNILSGALVLYGVRIDGKPDSKFMLFAPGEWKSAVEVPDDV